MWLQVVKNFTLIRRRESTIPKVKPLVLTYSACPYKNYVPRWSQKPQELFNYYLVCIYLVRKLVRGNRHTKQKKKYGSQFKRVKVIQYSVTHTFTQMYTHRKVATYMTLKRDARDALVCMHVCWECT